MDPPLKSTLTSIVVAVCGGALYAVGATTAQEQTTVAGAIVGAAGLLVGVAATWWKARQHTQQAAIDAINKPKNGLVVAREDSGVPVVTQPLKGTK